MAELSVLFFGDVVGRIGREALKRALPGLKAEFKPDLTVVNAENLAHGKGANPEMLVDLRKAGVDFFTGGNHILKNQKIVEIWDRPETRDLLIRPANFPDGTAGEGEKVLELGKNKVLVVNLLCQVFMAEPYGNPFKAIDAILKRHEHEDLAAVIVDLHGEATSEKVAFGLYVDSRVSAVLGTHTHVPTADARILPGGTAYVSDVGMVGARWSVLGVAPEGPISRFLEDEIRPFEIPESGPVDINAVVVRIDAATRKAVAIRTVNNILE